MLIYVGVVASDALKRRAANNAVTSEPRPKVPLTPAGFPFAALVEVYGLGPTLEDAECELRGDVLVGSEPGDERVHIVAETLVTLATQPVDISAPDTLATRLLRRCVAGAPLSDALADDACRGVLNSDDDALLWATVSHLPRSLLPESARACGTSLLDATKHSPESRQSLLVLAAQHRWPLPAQRLADEVLAGRPPADPRPLIGALSVADQPESEAALVRIALAHAHTKSTHGSRLALAALEALRRLGGPHAVAALTPLLKTTTMLIRTTTKQTLDGLHRRLGDQAGELSIASHVASGQLSEPSA